MPDPVTPVKEEVVEEELTKEQQDEQDALLSVLDGDVKGELKPNRSLDDEEVTGADEEHGSEVNEETEEEIPPAEDDEVDEGAETGKTEPVEEVSGVVAEPDETGVYAPVTVPDPGDFQPKDYSFSLQTTDGRTHKISTPEDAEQFALQLDTNPELISASQFLMLGRKTAQMEQGIATDRFAYDQAKTQHEAQAAQQVTRDQYLNQWQGEINYLQSKDQLPPVAPALNGADWTDPKVASEPGIKERLEIFKYMETENNSRMEAGLPPDLSIVSAYKAMVAEQWEAGVKEADNKEKGVRRSRGAMVGGKAPYEPAVTSPGNLVGAPKGLDELATEAYYAV